MDINQRLDLAREIRDAIHGITWPVNAQEPDYIAQLVKDLPGHMKNILTGLLPRRQISVGGAFIHQKPIVHFIKEKGYSDPELGDLLVVCREKRFSGMVYNAMLLQAKCSPTPLNTKIPNDHQFVLYSKWPEFEYRRAGVLNGVRRSVLPKTITQGAQYLLINKNCPYDLFTATVDIPLNSSSPFACTLASVVSFDEGRTIQTTNPRDDWSQMILDLLRLSAASVFNRRKAGFKNTQRWNGDKAFDFILNPSGKDKNTGNTLSDSFVKGEKDTERMGIICIDIGEMIPSEKL